MKAHRYIKRFRSRVLLRFTGGLLSAVLLSAAQAATDKVIEVTIAPAQSKVSEATVKPSVKASGPGVKSPSISTVSNPKSSSLSGQSESDAELRRREANTSVESLKKAGIADHPRLSQQPVVVPLNNGQEKVQQLKDLNEAASAANQAKLLQQRHNAQQKMREFNQGAGNMKDPASDSALKGAGPGIQEWDMPALRGMQGSDCVTNPADCVSTPGERQGDFSDPTHSGAAAVGAPSDPGTAATTGPDRVASAATGNQTSTKMTYENSDGSTTVVTLESTGNKMVETITTVDKDGELVGMEVTLFSPRGIETQSHKGKINVEYRNVNDLVGQPTQGGDSAWVSRDACNYNPVTGKCQGNRRPSYEEMTGQPSPTGAGTESGSSSGPNVGTDAVTNPGGGDWSVDPGRAGGRQTKPYGGVVDPEEEIPGGPVPAPGDGG